MHALNYYQPIIFIEKTLTFKFHLYLASLAYHNVFIMIMAFNLFLQHKNKKNITLCLLTGVISE